MVKRRTTLLIALAFTASGCAIVADEPPGEQRPLWFAPRNAALDEVLFPFQFTWAFNEVQEPTALPVADDNAAVSYRITAGSDHICMRVRQANYTSVFRSGDFACFLNGYRFESATAMNEFITYRRAGQSLQIEGFRREGGGYVPISETVTLIAISS